MVRLALIASIGIVLAAYALPAAAHESPHILILNSYHPGYAWSDDVQAALLHELSADLPDTDIVIEYLDSKHYPNLRHRQEFLALLKRKYANLNVSLIVTLDNPALEFVLDHRDVFRDIPVVFGGVNGFSPALLRGDTSSTGVPEELDPGGTIRIALRLQPQLREFVVLNDTTVTGAGSARMLEAARPQLPGEITWRFLPPDPLPALAAELRALPPTSAVLLLSYANDNRGTVYNSTAVPEQLRDLTPVPVYAVHGPRLGHGIAGGLLLDAAAHGEQVAALVQRVLAGEAAGNIPVDTTPRAVPMFDERELRRHRLDPALLPAGSTVINRLPSVWRDHPRQAAAATGIIAVLALLVVLLLVNIVRRRRAEAELRTLDERKTNLLSNVSHELRTPLVAIRGYAELISEGLSGSVTPRQQEQLGVVIRNIDRLLELIDHLLAFARLESGALQLRCRPLDLRAVVQDAIATVTPKAQRAQVLLTVQTDADPVMVNGDADRLQQLLANLLDNGIKFTPPGGSVSVDLHADGVAARLTVRDTGPGIPAAAQERIFDRFFQADAGITRRHSGTGIGLALVREIAHRHNGTVAVRSTEGEGAQFTVLLPLHTADGER